MKDSLFDLASSMRSIKVSVNGKEVLEENIMDIEIHWNTAMEVQASMILKDNEEILASFKDFHKVVVTIFVTDLTDETMSRDFYIAHMVEARGEEDNTKTLVFNMIDTVSYTLKNSYISKGYSGRTLKAIIEDLFEIFKINSLIDEKYIKLNIADSGVVYDAIVVPQDRSVYSFLEFQLNQEGSLMYQNKTSIEINNIDNIYPKTLTKDDKKDFKEDVENVNYGYKILEFSAEYSSAYDNLKLPAKTTFMYNAETKTMKKLSANVGEIWENIKTTDTDEKYVQGTDLINGGARYHIKEVNSPLKELAKETYFHYIENTSVEIFVNGNINGNKLLEKRGATFKGSSLHVEGMTEGNVILGGDYIVLSIHDKILGNKMIQKILIGRVNNTGIVAPKETTEAGATDAKGN